VSYLQAAWGESEAWESCQGSSALRGAILMTGSDVAMLGTCSGLGIVTGHQGTESRRDRGFNPA